MDKLEIKDGIETVAWMNKLNGLKGVMPKAHLPEALKVWKQLGGIPVFSKKHDMYVVVSKDEAKRLGVL